MEIASMIYKHVLPSEPYQESKESRKEIVIASSKFQIVIPKSIRERWSLSQSRRYRSSLTRTELNLFPLCLRIACAAFSKALILQLSVRQTKLS